MTSHVFENATEALPALLNEVLHAGHTTASRNGETRELTMQQITLTNPFPAEITTPGRRVSLPAQIAETMWILSGRNDIGWLSNYLPRAADFSDDGVTWRGGYGPRLRGHGPENVDQLAHIVQLLRTDPGTRRAVFTISDPSIDIHPGKDQPCNLAVHFLPRDGELHAHVFIRSNDLMWGWSGINSFEWATVLNIVAGLTGLQRGSITFSISSLHLYAPHWNRAQKMVDDYTDRFDLPAFPVGNPRFNFRLGQSRPFADFDELVDKWFTIETLIRTEPKGNASRGGLRSKIDNFPEPMMRSWLQVLHAWHNDDPLLATGLQGTSLFYALHNSPKKSAATEPTPVAAVAKRVAEPGSFGAFVSNLRAEKHEAYGDSWKKRGEMLGIMANLARKVDRLGVTGGGDTAADTAIDLLAYAVKYRLWLSENTGAPRPAEVPAEGQLTSGPEHADYVTAMVLQALAHPRPDKRMDDAGLIEMIREDFDSLESDVERKVANRWRLVDFLIDTSAPLARSCWEHEQAEPAKEQWKVHNDARCFTGYAAEGEIV